MPSIFSGVSMGDAATFDTADKVMQLRDLWRRGKELRESWQRHNEYQERWDLQITPSTREEGLLDKLKR